MTDRAVHAPGTRNQRTVTVHVVVPARGAGSNVYALGFPCRDCDDTYDPHHRTGVPCRNAAAHAALTAANWGPGARVETVEVPAGDLDTVVARARAAAAARPGSPGTRRH
ncbi:hypothetical protein Acsp03_70790 [Actinomadura sp. NBRC 104412]|uniref:hypothetical protein n=1 Tax=Actinomadura sp. NBRC 104412 TaxID=3032203 RepID=UPI0024A36A7A|nr:hypothetical protein [Actinomadura sp. NBRC 104412]GLZ09613.1 hypothetical protein Acsp03_70790 [Actinomadura sp. NBRC 104412]